MRTDPLRHDRRLDTRPVDERFWEKVDRSSKDGCWPWLAARFDARGYGAFKKRDDRGRWKMERAHRVAWMLVHGAIPAGMVVCHRCDNPPCCNPEHLFLGTALDNNRDAAAKGRTARGERHGSKTHPERVARGDRHAARKGTHNLPRGDQHWTHVDPHRVRKGEDSGNAKVTVEIVQQIRARFAAGETPRKIAESLGISRSQTVRIARKESWGHV